jgi:RNA polymerase sigma-70 factor (ECF subfamily)
LSSFSKKEEITQWYEEYSLAIFNFILMTVQDYQQAEDLTNETFLKAYKHYESFKRNSKPQTWLFSIAHNVSVDFLRKRKPLKLFRDLIMNQVGKGPTPEEIVHIKENSKELYVALGNLKDTYRRVIILRKIKGFSIIETAEILNWSESKVKSTLSRAIPALEQQLIKEGYMHEKSI